MIVNADADLILYITLCPEADWSRGPKQEDRESLTTQTVRLHLHGGRCLFTWCLLKFTGLPLEGDQVAVFLPSPWGSVLRPVDSGQFHLIS